MPSIDDIYKSNSEYLKAEDIGNEFWTFTIKDADVKKFDDGTSKLVLSFAEWEGKTMPLNVTNARSIASMYGHNSDAWIGKQIMLFTMNVDYQGKQVLAIRIRPPVQQPKPGSPTQTSHQRPLDRPSFAEAGPVPAGPREFAPVDDSDIPF